MARIKHIALTTKDPAKAAEFYKAAFGLKELRRSPNGSVFLTDGYIHVAVLRYKTEKDADVGAHGPNFDGIHHFGFEVERSRRGLPKARSGAGATVDREGRERRGDAGRRSRQFRDEMGGAQRRRHRRLAHRLGRHALRGLVVIPGSAEG